MTLCPDYFKLFCLCHTAGKSASKMFSLSSFCLDMLHAMPIFSLVLGKKLHSRKDC